MLNSLKWNVESTISMSISPTLLKEAIAEARAYRNTHIYDEPTLHVGVADTLKEAKRIGGGCQCSRCRTVVRAFSTSNSLRGQNFDKVEAFYVSTENPILWRDLLMCMAASKTSGPIFYTPSKKYLKRQAELAKIGADECTCRIKPCVCWHDEK